MEEGAEAVEEVEEVYELVVGWDGPEEVGVGRE